MAAWVERNLCADPTLLNPCIFLLSLPKSRFERTDDEGHCHAASGLRSRWRFCSQGDEENQLSRLPLSAEIIQQAIWLYLRFTLSLRDVEDLLAERGIMVSYETVRRWVNHFGPMIVADLRRRRSKPHTTWHLDEVYLKIDGRPVYLWRAVDAEGEVLDVLIQTRRNKRAALKLMRKLLKKYSFVAAKHQKTARYFSSEMMPMMISNTRVPRCRSSMGC